MKALKSIILNGWPDSKSSVPSELHDFWKIRDELSEIDNIMFRGERILIPKGMREEMLQLIHIGHKGIEKSKQRARYVIVWPGMSSQIADLVSKCARCLELRNSQQKEPMIPSNIPTKPWEKTGTDLFMWNGSDYLIVTDYYSRLQN